MSCSLLIPAAGYGGRFSELTKLPKALIKFRWHGSPHRTMMRHSGQLQYALYDQRLVVCQAQHEQLFKLMEPSFHTVPIDNSRNQADSVMRGMVRVPKLNDVLVVNCDNGIRFPYSTFVDACRALRVSCGVLSVEVEGGAYGYLDRMPNFTRAVEGVYDARFSSKFIIAGAFYFASPDTYLDEYDPRFASVSECFPFMERNYAMPLPRWCLHAWAGTKELLTDESVTEILLEGVDK